MLWGINTNKKDMRQSKKRLLIRIQFVSLLGYWAFICKNWILCNE